MRPEDLSDERLDETLRRQPRWTPPLHFARVVVARMPAVAGVPPSAEPSRVREIVRAVLTGVSGAILAYLGGMVILRATPVLIAHGEVVGWIGAAVGLLIAASVTGRAREWI